MIWLHQKFLANIRRTSFICYVICMFCTFSNQYRQVTKTIKEEWNIWIPCKMTWHTLITSCYKKLINSSKKYQRYTTCDLLLNILYTPHKLEMALKTMKNKGSNSGINKWIERITHSQSTVTISIYQMTKDAS